MSIFCLFVLVDVILLRMDLQKRTMNEIFFEFLHVFLTFLHIISKIWKYIMLLSFLSQDSQCVNQQSLVPSLQTSYQKMYSWNSCSPSNIIGFISMMRLFIFKVKSASKLSPELNFQSFYCDNICHFIAESAISQSWI